MFRKASLLIVTLAFGTSTFILPRVAMAWDHLGHMLAARIAYEGLSEQEREDALEILRHHPHYEAYLLVGVPSDPAEQSEYVFVKAATWPDAVRPPFPGQPPLIKDPDGNQKNVTAFHRANWHYINRMYVLPEDASDATSDGKDANVEKGDVKTNLQQSADELKSAETAAKQKAISFCWLLHLGGDIHQPLHCATFISSDFPPGEGDRGGNSISIKVPPHSKIKATELHAYWDGLLGSVDMHQFDNTDLARIDSLGRSLIKEEPKTSLNEFAQHTTIESWVNESYDLAAQNAYLNGHVFPGGWQKTDAIQLTADYEKSAIAIAHRRLALAGYRIETLLHTALSH